MKAVLIATIGTRDLMFQISSGTWYNIGDDRMQNGDIIGEQAEVISDQGLGVITFRDLTKYLHDHITTYLERIKPVIIGQLLTNKASDIERVYLIATDQKLEVLEREKDTLYAASLIKAWIVNQFDRISGDAVEVITVGPDGTNPSNFEEMFHWWRQTWKEKITIKSSQPIWVCLKGRVGQASEASRISGLSLYGDRIQFFEFKQNTKANRAGIPSDYSGPFFGTNYLWDRTQQQALKLLYRGKHSDVLLAASSWRFRSWYSLGGKGVGTKHNYPKLSKNQKIFIQTFYFSDQGRQTRATPSRFRSRICLLLVSRWTKIFTVRRE